MNEAEDAYPCVGVCLFDPDNGYCLGCGRPPLPVSIAGQVYGGDGLNEKAPLPHSSSATSNETSINHETTRNSQEK
ncbi:MAG: DUF1289 domain-containing protein [Propionivibrio sp.]|uniref:DUF1289 domain-containing protein n=1 Tax=Propionivibrio sp. TaxID=2212460 RepID=UPI001A4A4A5E|nr:DUF1289 domain-containing protein [Propionivibrio sp.]MBL8415360.1 DUF1289 domain-containing protein [Propionivibrio sp.]